MKTQDGSGPLPMVWLVDAAVGFGRRWGARAEALRGEVRAKLASRVYERPLLADAITKLESTLAADFQQRADVSSSTEAVVHSLQESVADHATSLAKAVEELARMGALLTERIEAERDERRALVDAVSLLAARALESTSVIETRGTEPRVVGGTVDAWPPGPSGGEIVLFDEMPESRDRPDETRAPGARHDDVIERVSELERVVEELRHADTVGAGTSRTAPGSAPFAMTPARAVDLTTAMHPKESSPHRWHRVPTSGGGQGGSLPVRVVFMLPPDD
jgi:hypothetical protein